MRKILLLGGLGYIGSAFYKALIENKYEVCTIRRVDVNYCDFKILREYIKSLNGIDFLINAAGFTGKPNVEQCEIKRNETLEGNLLLPQTISCVAEVEKFRWLQVSSGCIYQGDNGGKGYSENDPPNFCFDLKESSFYSGVKALSESTLQNDPHCYITRLRIPFDKFDHKSNLLTKLQNYKTIFNSINSLTHIGDYINICLELYEKECPAGIYNVTNEDSISTREIVDSIQRILKSDKVYEYFESEEDFYKYAKVVRSCCVLNIDKIKKLGIKTRNINDAIIDSLKNWVKK